MVRTNILDVAMAITAGIFGYLMRRYGFPLITIAIGYILGPLAEKSWIQSMQISDGSVMIFVEEPIALVLLLAALATLLVPIVAVIRKSRARRAAA
jgi:putative tricarboxylic transport membrane protein